MSDNFIYRMQYIIKKNISNRGEFMVNKKDENKKEKFIRLAEKRLENAVKNIERLVALGDRTRYDYSEKQSRYIIKILKESVSRVEQSFQGKNVDKKIKIPIE